MNSTAIEMDRMYRWQRRIYDLTRKPYLLGRDRMIDALGVPPEGAVLEIACGTGRNLIQAARKYPHGTFHGFDISRAMLEQARHSVDRAGLGDQIELTFGDAEQFDVSVMFGRELYDRVFISYSLSMIPQWRRTMDLAASTLAPGGALLIADFYDCRNLPRVMKAFLYAWLRVFDVRPRENLHGGLEGLAKAHRLNLDFEPLYGGYAALALLRRPHV